MAIYKRNKSYSVVAIPRDLSQRIEAIKEKTNIPKVYLVKELIEAGLEAKKF